MTGPQGPSVPRSDRSGREDLPKIPSGDTLGSPHDPFGSNLQDVQLSPRARDLAEACKNSLSDGNITSWTSKFWLRSFASSLEQKLSKGELSKGEVCQIVNVQLSAQEESLLDLLVRKEAPV